MLKFSFINVTKYFDLADGSLVNFNLTTETTTAPSPQTRGRIRAVALGSYKPVVNSPVPGDKRDAHAC